MRASRTNDAEDTVPLSTWPKVLGIVAIALFVVALLDRQIRVNHPYVVSVYKQLDNFVRKPEKPLVIAIGASSLMFSTPPQLDEEVFDWLRLVVRPSSNLDDINVIADQIIELSPDFLLITFQRLVKPIEPISFQRLSELLRELMSSPDRVLFAERFESDKNCDHLSERVLQNPDHKWNFDRAAKHQSARYKDGYNALGKSSFLARLRKHGVTVIFIRTPVLDEVESRSPERLLWMQKAKVDLKTRGYKTFDDDEKFAIEDFCDDYAHVNRIGRKSYTQWLVKHINSEFDL